MAVTDISPLSATANAAVDLGVEVVILEEGLSAGGVGEGVIPGLAVVAGDVEDSGVGVSALPI